MNLKLVLTVVFVVAMIVPISLAANCWSNGDNRGWIDNTNLVGPPGAIKSCEAKLHECFKVDGGDPALACSIASPMGCMAACGSPYNVGCSVEVCNSRCMAARVLGSADTCD